MKLYLTISLFFPVAVLVLVNPVAVLCQTPPPSDSTAVTDSIYTPSMDAPPAPQPAVAPDSSESDIVDDYSWSFGRSGPTINMQQVNMDHGVPLSKNPTKAFIMSLLIPGMGQVYTHNYFKAAAFFGTDIGMLAGIFQQDRLSRENLLMGKQTEADGAPESIYGWHYYLSDFYKNDRNKLIWWTAGVTLLSAVDAYVEAHLYDFHIDPTLGVAPQGDGVTTGLRITFGH